MLEIYSLLTTAILLLLLAFVSTALYGKQVGNPALLSNRDNIKPPEGAAKRAQRAHLNLLENAVPFAIVVLTSQALGLSSAITQTAAVIFVVARIIHAFCYIAGIAGIRTFAWLAGVVATIVIAASIAI